MNQPINGKDLRKSQIHDTSNQAEKDKRYVIVALNRVKNPKYVIGGKEPEWINQVKVVGNTAGKPFKDKKSCQRIMSSIDGGRIRGLYIMGLEITPYDKC